MSINSDEKLEKAGGFNSIAFRYDLANRLISLGMDKKWREKLIRKLPVGQKGKLLDLACGTGDMVCMAARELNYEVTALDSSSNMLGIAKGKISSSRVCYICHDMHELPFEDNCFDCVTIVFGLRNARDIEQVLTEVSRVLVDGGRLMILEFSMPERMLVRAIFKIYFSVFMPLIGWAVTGNYKMYRYLYSSVNSFYSSAEMANLLVKHGFSCNRESMSLSTVWLYDCVSK